MTEFYEFAKQVDVIVIFFLLYGFAIGSTIVSSSNRFLIPNITFLVITLFARII